MCFIPIDIFTRVFGLCSSSATKNEKKKHNKPAMRAQSSSPAASRHDVHLHEYSYTCHEQERRQTHVFSMQQLGLSVSNGCKKLNIKKQNSTGHLDPMKVDTDAQTFTRQSQPV